VTTANAAPAATAVNTIVVNGVTADTTVTSTFGGVAGFTVLGDSAPAGTINMANLPATINTITFFGGLTAAGLTVTNAVTTLTINIGNFAAAIAQAPLIVSLPTGNAVTTNSLTVNLGGTTANTSALQIVGNGEDTIFIASGGPTGGTNVLEGLSQSGVVVNAVPGAVATLNISGATTLFTNSLIVNGIGGTGIINDTATAQVQIFGFGGGALTGISTNAAAINGATSGGIFMGGADTSFVGVNGDFIAGSTVAGKSNILAGSLGNDTFTSGTGTDTITTDNGGDIINLGVTHTADMINLFFGNFTLPAYDGGFAGGFALGLTGLPGSTVAGATDFAQPGTWGVAPAATPAATPFTLFAHTTALNNGTSADMSVVTNYLVGTGVANADILNFSTGAWAAGAGSHGLDNSAGVAIAAGAVANIFIQGAGTVVAAAVNVIELLGNFANANAVAFALGNNAAAGASTYNLVLNAAPTADAHYLVMYNDGTGATRIADVDITGASTSTTADAVVASDIVQLKGIAATALTANNIHFIV